MLDRPGIANDVQRLFRFGSWKFITNATNGLPNNELTDCKIAIDVGAVERLARRMDIQEISGQRGTGGSPVIGFEIILQLESPGNFIEPDVLIRKGKEIVH